MESFCLEKSSEKSRASRNVLHGATTFDRETFYRTTAHLLRKRLTCHDSQV